MAENGSKSMLPLVTTEKSSHPGEDEKNLKGETHRRAGKEVAQASKDKEKIVLVVNLSSVEAGLPVQSCENQ
jgi:hypothetical protein